MHVKCIVVDESVLLDGSCNMTHNGHGNNKEHLYRIIDPLTVAEVLQDLQKCWCRRPK